MEIRLILNQDNTRNLNWFDSTNFTTDHREYSFPEQLDETQQQKQLRLIISVKHMMGVIERTIINRCLESPYRKNVGNTSLFIVGYMDDDCWNLFSTNQSPDRIKHYHRNSPTAGRITRQVLFSSLNWEGTATANWPVLFTHGWYLVAIMAFPTIVKTPVETTIVEIISIILWAPELFNGSGIRNRVK